MSTDPASRPPRRWLRRLLVWVVLPLGLVLCLLFGALFYMEGGQKQAMRRQYESARRAIGPLLAPGETARTYYERVVTSAGIPDGKNGEEPKESPLPDVLDEQSKSDVRFSFGLLEDLPESEWAGHSEFMYPAQWMDRLIREHEARLADGSMCGRVVSLPLPDQRDPWGKDGHVLGLLYETKELCAGVRWLFYKGEKDRALTLLRNATELVLSTKGVTFYDWNVQRLVRGQIQDVTCDLWTLGHIRAAELAEILRIAEANPPRLDGVVAGHAAYLTTVMEYQEEHGLDDEDSRGLWTRIEELFDGTARRDREQLEREWVSWDRLCEGLAPGSPWHLIHTSNGSGAIPAEVQQHLAADAIWAGDLGHHEICIAYYLHECSRELAGWCLLAVAAGVQCRFSPPSSRPDMAVPASDLWDLLLALEGTTSASMLHREYQWEGQTRRLHVMLCPGEGTLWRHYQREGYPTASVFAPHWLTEAARQDSSLPWPHEQPNDSSGSSPEGPTDRDCLEFWSGNLPQFPVKLLLGPVAGPRD